MPDIAAERFSSRKEAHAWLLSEGARVSRSKFYADCAAGVVPVLPDKTVSKYLVSRYLLSLQREAMPDQGMLDRQLELDSLELRKRRLEVEALEVKQRREDSRWMLVEDGWSAIAALLARLQDNLRHQFFEAQGVLVHCAGGEQSRGPEVYEECEAVIARAYNDLAGAQISGLFAVVDDDEEEDDGAQ